MSTIIRRVSTFIRNPSALVDGADKPNGNGQSVETEAKVNGNGSAVVADAAANDNDPEWVSRSACPMLNICANLGVLPHNGRNVSAHDLYNAMRTVANVQPDLALVLIYRAFRDFKKLPIRIPSQPYASHTFTLEEVSTHDIVEHHASLTRADFIKDDRSKPLSGMLTSEEMIDEVCSLADAEGFITVESIARIRIERERRASPPLTAHQKDMGCGEAALVFQFFGVDENGGLEGESVKVHGDVFRALGNDRLPEGYVRRGPERTHALAVQSMVNRIAKVKGELEGTTANSEKRESKGEEEKQNKKKQATLRHKRTPSMVDRIVSRIPSINRKPSMRSSRTSNGSAIPNGNGIGNGNGNGHAFDELSTNLESVLTHLGLLQRTDLLRKAEKDDGSVSYEDWDRINRDFFLQGRAIGGGAGGEADQGEAVGRHRWDEVPLHFFH